MWYKKRVKNVAKKITRRLITDQQLIFKEMKNLKSRLAHQSGSDMKFTRLSILKLKYIRSLNTDKHFTERNEYM